MNLTTKRRFAKAGQRAFGAIVGIAMVVATLVPALAQTVVVQGNRRVETDVIRSFVTGTDTAALEDARKGLVSSGLFSEVRVSRGSGGAVVVSVVENELVNRVVFEGNKKVVKDVLLGEIQTKARGPYNPATVVSDVQRILDVYKRTGRGLATVTTRTVQLPNGRVDVIFTVVEGGKTGVKEINFSNNSVYSGGKLRGLMTTTEMNFLSFLKNSDVYDSDRIASDLELIRRFYLKNGYADFRIVSNDAQFDAARGGWIVSIVVDEGPQYRFGDVRVQSNLRDVDAAVLEGQLTTRSGAVYNAEAVEKSIQGLTTEVQRRGFAFAQIRPSGGRDPATLTIAVVYVVEEGPRVFIEKIVVRGNTRTRDFVVRRELDLGEGDAFNKVLVDRAERRLNALGFFKRVRITNEPGSTPDRVIVNIDVEDQSTGQFSISGGFSTSDGLIGEVAVSESNFLGRGQFVRVAGTLGQRTQGIDFSFTEPYFLGQRMAAGIDLFSRFNDNTNFARFENRTTGGQLRLGLPLNEATTVTLRYSLFQQEIDIPNTTSKPFNDCTIPIPGFTVLNADGTPNFPTCTSNGEASIAIKQAVGQTITSLAGLTLSYNTLDNPREPRNGFAVELKPDVAGLGGDSKYFRLIGDARYFRELTDDIVGIARIQGGFIRGYGDNELRIVDNFFLGPGLVRGFAPSGIGPRDESGDPAANALGGTTYFGGSLEVQFPIFGLPREIGLKGAVFADAGTLFGYHSPRAVDINNNGILEGFAPGCTGRDNVQPECIRLRDDKTIRSSVGASILWQSPLGPIRFDYAFALSKADGDQTQAFRFSGGSRF